MTLNQYKNLKIGDRVVSYGAFVICNTTIEYCQNYFQKYIIESRAYNEGFIAVKPNGQAVILNLNNYSKFELLEAVDNG